MKTAKDPVLVIVKDPKDDSLEDFLSEIFSESGRFLSRRDLPVKTQFTRHASKSPPTGGQITESLLFEVGVFDSCTFGEPITRLKSEGAYQGFALEDLVVEALKAAREETYDPWDSKPDVLCPGEELSFFATATFVCGYRKLFTRAIPFTIGDKMVQSILERQLLTWKPKRIFYTCANRSRDPRPPQDGTDDDPEGEPIIIAA